MSVGYGLSLVTAAAQDPCTIAEAKKQVDVAITDSQHDAHLARLIKAATALVESRTGRAICTQAWDMLLDELPDCNELLLPKAPLQSVTHLKYYDSSGVQQTWSNTNYIVSTSREPGRLSLANGVSWPSVQIRPDAISVRYVCGYGTQTSAPEGLKAAVLLLVGHWFENRTAGAPVDIKAIPFAVEALIEQYMVGDEFIQYTGIYG